MSDSAQCRFSSKLASILPSKNCSEQALLLKVVGLQSLPGVQPDSDGKYSVQGGLPFMSETSVDGISTQNVGSNNPLSDAWPSAETITELRVDGVSNNAELGQPGAVTSITKSGSNDY